MSTLKKNRWYILNIKEMVSDPLHILQMLYKNQYREAPVSGDNAFLINIGKLVEDIIDNKLISVRHRVVEVDYTRYSITYFLGPSLVIS